MTGEASTRTPGEMKQQILRIYNEVNQRISGVGVRRQHIDLLGDRILIVAEHARIPALKVLDGEQRDLTRVVDTAIIDVFRRELKVQIQDAFGLEVLAVLKDYDPLSHLAATVIILKQDPLERLSV